MKQNEVAGKTVIRADGHRVGEVKEVAFSLEGRLGFVVATATGEEQTVPFESVQAVGEFIILRAEAATARAAAPAPAAAAGPVPATLDAPAGPPAGSCGKCGKTPREGARFCNHCGHAIAAAGA